MASKGPESIAPITLDQLISLNDEIAALVRVGVPLEQGLVHLASDMPGRLGKAASQLGERMKRGESLPNVLAASPEVFPPVYRAVVEAGMRTGHLALALEAVAGMGRRMAEARRMVAISLLYPLLVFLLTWGLFVLFAVTMAWRFLDFMSDLPSQGPLVLVGKAVLTQIVGWQQTASIWGPAVPAVVVIAAGLWYFFSARATMIEPRATGLFLGWLPWTGRMLRSLRTAAMADILGMLVEHGVPLNTAVVMASEAMGGPRTARAAQGLAEALRRGEPLDRNVELISAFPPAVTWAIVAGDRQRSLATALRHVAEIYHQRAQYQGEAARVFVPILLTLAIGGTVAVVYALLILGTWFSVLRALA